MGESKNKLEALGQTPLGECCGNCRFGIPAEQEGATVCRRYPPTQSISGFFTQPVAAELSLKDKLAGVQPQLAGTQSTVQLASSFPVMASALGWCGEHKPKETIQ